jgi:hypothetical protein
MRVIVIFLLLIAQNALAQYRILLEAPLTLYVNCQSGSDSNPGTESQPFATPKRAYYYAQQKLDLGGNVITAQLQSGCTDVITDLHGPLVGARGATGFVFQGTVGSHGAVLMSTSLPGAWLWHAYNGASYSLQWMQMKATGGGAVLVGEGVINVGHIYWDAASVAHLDAAGPRSVINTFGQNWILHTGSVNTHAVAEDHALITMSQHLSVSACPYVYNSFVQGDLGGIIDATGFTWSDGCLQGTRYHAVTNGIVFTGHLSGQAPWNFFPGSSPGAVGTGGYFQ